MIKCDICYEYRPISPPCKQCKNCICIPCFYRLDRKKKCPFCRFSSYVEHTLVSFLCKFILLFIVSLYSTLYFHIFTDIVYLIIQSFFFRCKNEILVLI